MVWYAFPQCYSVPTIFKIVACHLTPELLQAIKVTRIMGTECRSEFKPTPFQVSVISCDMIRITSIDSNMTGNWKLFASQMSVLYTIIVSTAVLYL